jgi:hypothetical protein
MTLDEKIDKYLDESDKSGDAFADQLKMMKKSSHVHFAKKFRALIQKYPDMPDEVKTGLDQIAKQHESASKKYTYSDVFSTDYSTKKK